MSDDQKHEELRAARLSRRSLVVSGTAGAAAAAFGTVLASGVFAQEATPEAGDINEGLDAGVGAQTPTAIGPALPPELTEFAADWPVYNGDITGKRVATSTITSENINTLEVAWTHSVEMVGFYGAFTSPALIIGETVYVQDLASNVHALDRQTGEVKWTKTYDVPSVGPNGISVAYGMIFGAVGSNAEAFALDAESGEELWKLKLTPNARERIDGAPSVYDNTVYFSTTPSYSGGSRGIVYALDASTGAVLWYFDTVNNLWGAPRINAGGGVWYPFAFDEEGNIFFGTGNPSPVSGTEEYPSGSSREEPNLYASSMVSLDAETGGVRWFYQDAPKDLFDHDFQLTPILGTINDAGNPRKAAIGAGKTGHVVACDADSGAVIWKRSVGEHMNDHITDIPVGEIVEIKPGTLAGVETPMALDGDVLYVPVINTSDRFTATAWSSGIHMDTATGEILALNSGDGTVIWGIETGLMPLAGITVANDLIFSGDLSGILTAHDKATGEQVWSFQTTAGINAPPSIAGDLLIIPSGGPFTGTLPDGQEVKNQLVALRLPGGDSATPAATPSS